LCPCAIQLSLGQSHDVGLGDARHGVELEQVQGLGVGQLAVDAVALQPPGFSFGDLVLQ